MGGTVKNNRGVQGRSRIAFRRSRPYTSSCTGPQAGGGDAGATPPMYRELKPSDRPTPDPVATPRNGQGGGERPEWRDKGREPGGRPEGRDGVVPRDSLSQGDQPARAVPLDPDLQGRSPCPFLCARSLPLPELFFSLTSHKKENKPLYFRDGRRYRAHPCIHACVPVCVREG